MTWIGGEQGVPRPLRYVLSLKGKGQSKCADSAHSLDIQLGRWGLELETI